MLQITTKVTRQSNSDMLVLIGHFKTKTDNNNTKENTGTFYEVINSNKKEKLRDF